ncbi:MAG: hypothetical protein ACLR2E_03695 [Lachnospiraceae bacterium]
MAYRGRDINELYDTVAALEKLGNKNLIIDCGKRLYQEAYAIAVQFRQCRYQRWQQNLRLSVSGKCS